MSAFRFAKVVITDIYLHLKNTVGFYLVVTNEVMKKIKKQNHIFRKNPRHLKHSFSSLNKNLKLQENYLNSLLITSISILCTSYVEVQTRTKHNVNNQTFI